jgi:hypothetical protein
MIRLLGFLVGSAASIGAIFLLLGVPELNLSNPNLDKERFEEALQQLRQKQREIEQVVADEAAPEKPAPNMPIRAEVPELPVAEQETTATDTSTTPTPAPTPTPVIEQHWHTFWNPFRTEIAARGFVSQLERVTVLDYRIIKVRTGVYEVAFAYESDTDRQLRLSQIQAATGLDLPGS